MQASMKCGTGHCRSGRSSEQAAGAALAAGALMLMRQHFSKHGSRCMMCDLMGGYVSKKHIYFIVVSMN